MLSSLDVESKEQKRSFKSPVALKRTGLLNLQASIVFVILMLESCHPKK